MRTSTRTPEEKKVANRAANQRACDKYRSSLSPDVKKKRAAERQARHRAKYASDPVFQAKTKADALRWARENPEKRKALDLRRHYGMTVPQLHAMIDNQAGLCGICTVPMKPGRDTNVDHDHATGRVRGLLCRSCNTRLGRIESDKLVASATLAYAEVR